MATRPCDFMSRLPNESFNSHFHTTASISHIPTKTGKLSFGIYRPARRFGRVSSPRQMSKVYLSPGTLLMQISFPLSPRRGYVYLEGYDLILVGRPVRRRLLLQKP